MAAGLFCCCPYQLFRRLAKICTSLVCTGPRRGSHRVLRLSTSLSSNVKWAKERLPHVDRCTSPRFHGHCPCCWRPLQFQVFDDGKPRDHSSSTITRNGKRAYVVAVWGSSLDYAIGAVALGQSLKATRTEHDLACSHTWDVPEWPHRYSLRRFWHLRQVSYLEPVTGFFMVIKIPLVSDTSSLSCT